MKKDLGLPTCITALLITAVVSIKTQRNPFKLARRISWATLVLVAGLFIMVKAIESQGALVLTQEWLAAAQRLKPALGALTVRTVLPKQQQLPGRCVRFP